MNGFSQLRRLAAAACVVVVSTSAGAQSLDDRIRSVAGFAPTAAAAPRTSKPTLLGALVYTKITVRFDGTPARAAIAHIASATGVSIVGRFDDDRTAEGIDPESPIDLSIDGRTALEALEMVLDQCSDDVEPCTWQLRRGFVEVGTKRRLASESAKEIRYYLVRDLLAEPPYFDNPSRLDMSSALGQSGGGAGGGPGGGLGGGGGGSEGAGGGSIISPPGEDPERVSEEERAAQLQSIIVATIEPDGWEDHGGGWARIRYHKGVLIVRAPDFVHRQINGYPFTPTRPRLSRR